MFYTIKTIGSHLKSSWTLQKFYESCERVIQIIGDNIDLEKVNETCGYHLQCYRNFTDISKLERAKTTIANSSIKRPAEDNSREIDGASHQYQTKVSRPKRHLLKERTTGRRPPTYCRAFA